MKKHHIIEKAGMVAILVAMTSFVQVQAADTAAANASLAEVAAMAGQAQADLATAANSGDLNAVAKATQRADAITAALEEAVAAVKAMAAASDETATASAEAALASAVQKASEAFGQMSGKTGGTSGKNSKPGDPPNIHDTPWKSAGLRSVGQGMFPISNFSESGGGAGYGERDYGDRDATPE